MAWHILLTTPGSEFKVRDELHRKGAWALVPVEFRLSKRKDQRPLKRPVLPGYVFASIDDWNVLHTPSIRTVRVGPDDFAHEAGPPQPIDGLRARPIATIDGRPVCLTQKEVDALQVLSRPLAALRMPGNRLRPGDRIKIKVGAMADLNACIERITKKGKAVAVVELFGKTNHVTLTPDQYEAA